MKMDTEELLDSENISDDFHEQKIFRVDANQSPLRIDKFIFDRIGEVSRNRIQEAIRAGAVLVDNQEVKPNFKVKPGQEVILLMPRSAHTGGLRIVPQAMPINVVYEDADLMVINKPPGLVVHPGVGHFKGTLVNGLAHYLNISAESLKSGNFQERVGLVHRIDKNTSGLLVIAKNEYSLSHLAKQFFYHTTERTYYALVWGEPDPVQGTVNAHVGRDLRHRQLFAAYPEGDHGKWAVTHYEVLEPMYYVSLIKCVLETGRTHQIRVHMKHAGHPLFNDDKYGGDEIHRGTVFSKYKTFVDHVFDLMPRHALHAKTLGFVHPTTNKFMQFDSEIPDDMQAALDAWRNYLDGRKSAMKGNLS
jgi:23S rRNA pseudouridine1911/1915/1917 synthase